MFLLTHANKYSLRRLPTRWKLVNLMIQQWTTTTHHAFRYCRVRFNAFQLDNLSRNSCIFKRGLHLSHVQGWDRTSAYIGAAGSRYQSISDLIQPTQPMNHEIAQRPTSTPGTPCPTLCDKCVGSLTSHRVMNNEVLWDGTYGLSSLSEKTRKSNRLQMSLQRQHFLLSYLKTLSVGPAGVRTHDLPHGSPVLNLITHVNNLTCVIKVDIQAACSSNIFITWLRLLNTFEILYYNIRILQ